MFRQWRLTLFAVLFSFLPIVLAVTWAPAASAQTACPENFACLSWEAPTQNVDGSELTDLAGYSLVWGDTSRGYTGRLLIADPAQTSGEFPIDPGSIDLAPLLPNQVVLASLFFAMTAIDADGNESAYSNEVIKAVTFTADVPDVPGNFDIQIPIRIPVPGGVVTSEDTAP